MSMIPYQKLTDDQKKVTFHVDGSSDDPVRHSGILPSGEGHYYDPDQTIRNDKIFDPIDPQDRNPVLLGRFSNHPVTPSVTEPSTFHPSGLEYTNITQSGEINNSQAYENGKYLPRNRNALSNNTSFLNNGFVQGGYIHYYSESSPGLMPDTDGAVEYYPTSSITKTTESFNPYPMYGESSRTPSINDDGFWAWLWSGKLF